MILKKKYLKVYSYKFDNNLVGKQFRYHNSETGITHGFNYTIVKVEKVSDESFTLFCVYDDIKVTFSVNNKNKYCFEFL